MNFLQRIENTMSDPRKNRGHRGQIVVDTTALRELVDDFKRLDSEARLLHNKRRVSKEQILHEAIDACYHDFGKDCEYLTLAIMRTLTPLIEKNRKEKELRRYELGR